MRDSQGSDQTVLAVVTLLTGTRCLFLMPDTEGGNCELGGPGDKETSRASSSALVVRSEGPLTVRARACCRFASIKFAKAVVQV